MLLKKNSYTVQILTSAEEIVERSSEWDSFLTECAAQHTFWQDPNVILYHLKKQGYGDPCVVLLRDNEGIKCVAPMVIAQSKFVLNFSIFKWAGPKLNILKLMGSDFVFGENVDNQKCTEEVLFSLKRKLSFDFISCDSLSSASMLYSALTEKKGQIHGFQLRSISPKIEKIRKHILEESYDLWLASLRGKTRGKIQRKIRSLYKRYHEQIELIKITQAEDIIGFLDYIQNLYPQTWQAKTFGPKEWNEKREIQFYQNVAKKGWLRSYLLLVDQKAVAFLVGFQYNGIFHHAECGYDPAFSRDGVGSVLNFLMIEDLYKTNKPIELNFGFGENEYKKILGNNEDDAFEARISLPGLGRFLVNLQCAVSFSEKTIRSVISKTKIEPIVRRLLKRK